MERKAISLELKLKQRKCVAKIVEREAPAEIQLLASLIKGKDSEFEPVMEECITWEEKEDYITLKEDFWEMVMVLSVEFLTSKGEQRVEHLLSFYNTFGPLFKRKVMPLYEVELYIETFFLFLMSYKQIFELKPGMPPAVGILEEYLYTPIEEAKRKYPTNKGMWELKGIYHTTPPKVILAPATKGARFLIKNPKGNIQSDREEMVKWIRGTVLNNVDRVLTGVKYKSQFAIKNKRFSIKATPKDAYTLAVLQATLKDTGYHACEECGKPSIGKICRSCSRKKNIKQNVLAIFRDRKKHGKVTHEEYEKIKGKANMIKEEGIFDKEELMESLEEYLLKLRNKPL